MKKLVLAFVLLCAALGTPQPKWTDPEAWKVKLQPYMTARQVQFLPGDPVGREVR